MGCRFQSGTFTYMVKRDLLKHDRYKFQGYRKEASVTLTCYCVKVMD